MTETATALMAPPDLLKRFVEAPFAASMATSTAVYQLKTNYAPLCDWLAGAGEGPGTRWNCTILYDPDYPIDPSDVLTFASEGLLLRLRPGYMISVDHVHHCIVVFLSEVVADQVAAFALMQELIRLSQSVVTENHANETERS